jgi:hypothetical protein
MVEGGMVCDHPEKRPMTKRAAEKTPNELDSASQTQMGIGRREPIM